MFFDLTFIIMMIIGSFFDIKKRIIPNKICLSLLLITAIKLILIITININNNNFSFIHFFLSLFFALLITLIFLGVPYFINNSIGGGDLKLGCCLGLFLGFKQTASVLFISFLSCAIFAIIINIIKYLTKKPKAKTLPFAPFLLLGLLYTLFIKYFF